MVFNSRVVPVFMLRLPKSSGLSIYGMGFHVCTSNVFQKYIENVRKTSMYNLEDRIIAAKKRLEFLVDFTSMSPAEMRLNAEAFNWHSRMPPIFEDHEEIIDSSKRQAENALKVR